MRGRRRSTRVEIRTLRLAGAENESPRRVLYTVLYDTTRNDYSIPQRCWERDIFRERGVVSRRCAPSSSALRWLAGSRMHSERAGRRGKGLGTGPGAVEGLFRAFCFDAQRTFCPAFKARELPESVSKCPLRFGLNGRRCILVEQPPVCAQRVDGLRRLLFRDEDVVRVPMSYASQSMNEYR